MAIELCPIHQLRFDSASGPGCVLCRRGAIPPGRKVSGVLVLVALGVAAVGLVLVLGAGVSRSVRSRSHANVSPDFTAEGKDYYPLALGSEWTYSHRVTLGDDAPDVTQRRYVVVEADPPVPGLFVLHEPARGLWNQLPMHYRHSDEGVVTSLGYITAQKTEFTPPFVELPNRLRVLEPWRWRGTSSGYPMEMESVLEGQETLTTPAGTFETLRIRRTLKGVPDAVSRHWYARNVGLVRAVSDRPAKPPLLPKNHIEVELLSYSLAQPE